MKRSTRILSIIMAIAMIVSSMVVVASAEEAAAATISMNATLTEDGKVAVAIIAGNDLSVISLMLDLKYTEGLTIVSVEDGGLLGGTFYHGEGSNYANNPYPLYWSDATHGTQENPTNYVANGTIATVIFELPETYYGKYEFSIDSYDAIAADEQSVEVECGETEIVIEEPVIDVTGIELDVTKATLTLNVDKPLQLTATVSPEGADYEAIVWASDAENVATVNDEGVVTAIAEGIANITATVGDFTATCVVTVEAQKIPAESIEIVVADGAIEWVGDTLTLTATVNPEDTTDKLTWSTSNDAVATVEDGVVTAVGAGEATITATAGAAVATYDVAVKAAVATLDDVKYETLAAAVEAAEENDEVVLVANTDEAIAVAKAISIKLNGFTAANVTAGEGYEMTNNVTALVFAVKAPEAVDVATLNGEKYTSVAAALSAAKSGETVTMIADATEGVVIINAGVTLNLDVYDLTATNIIAFTDSAINGVTFRASGDFAKLYIAKDAMIHSGKPAADGSGRPILPVWAPNLNCYVFSRFAAVTSGFTSPTPGFAYNEEFIEFYFKQDIGGDTYKTYFKDGLSDNALKLVVHLEWSDENGTYEQEYVYNDYFTGLVSTEAAAGKLKIYMFKLLGYEYLNIDPTAVTIKTMVISDSGVAYVGDTWTSAGVQK